jgi:cytochrome c
VTNGTRGGSHGVRVRSIGVSALAQGPTYMGRTPTAEKCARWISPSARPDTPAGKRHGQGGRAAFRAKDADATARRDRRYGAQSESKDPKILTSGRGRTCASRSFATTVWDYINRGMPSIEGTLTADKVYALTAYLLSINDVIPEDETLDAQVCRRSRCNCDNTLPCRTGSPGRQAQRLPL